MLTVEKELLLLCLFSKGGIIELLQYVLLKFVELKSREL